MPLLKSVTESQYTASWHIDTVGNNRMELFGRGGRNQLTPGK